MTEIRPFEPKKDNQSNRMKLGKAIPEGGVNIGYVQTAPITPEESISLIDKSYITDNVIPIAQQETIARANEQGELEFVQYIDQSHIEVIDPGTIFPSKDVAITNQFFENTLRNSNALYFISKILYHYDNKKGEKNDDGEYDFVEYKGKQITITDEFGQPITGKDKFQIFTKAMAVNPNIHEVYVYMHEQTDKNKTFKITYNHIEQPVADEFILNRTVELYSSTQNVEKVTKEVLNQETGLMEEVEYTYAYLEMGKTRVLNTETLFTEVSEQDLLMYSLMDNPPSAYALIEHEKGLGYKIKVPSKTEQDKRTTKEFGYVINASFKDPKTGVFVSKSSGLINDVFMHPDSLVPAEYGDYTTESKMIGITAGHSTLNVRDILNMSMPYGTPRIPDTATFEVIGTDKNRNYYEVHHPPKEDLIVGISDNNYAKAHFKNMEIKKWPLAEKSTTALSEKALEGSFSIIPERQKVRWPFEFDINGTGIIVKKPSVDLKWFVCADVAFDKLDHPKKLDLHKYNKWAGIGKRKDLTPARDDIVYEYNEDIKRICLQFQNKTSHDMVGIYETSEHYDQSIDVSRAAAMNPYSNVEGEIKMNVNPMEQHDYEFSTKVRMAHKDDDVIGVIFRVQNGKEFYLFAWEKDERTYKGMQAGEIPPTDEGDDELVGDDIYPELEPDETDNEGDVILENGSETTDDMEPDEVVEDGGIIDDGAYQPAASSFVEAKAPADYGYGYRFLLDEGGASHVMYNPTSTQDDKLSTPSMKKFINELGMGKNHKRIYKVTPADGSTRLPKDLTGCSFEDITDKTSTVFNSSIGQRGWRQNVDYKITVEVKGNEFNIYVDENASETGEGRGTLCCKAKDDSYKKGSYGVLTISQWDTFWWDLEIMPIENKIICSPERTTVITTEEKQKLSNYTAPLFMDRYIDQYRESRYKNKKYRIRKYFASNAGELGTISVDADKFHYIWFTPNPEVIKTLRVMFRTEEQGLTVKGKGTVNFMPDGTFEVDYYPRKINVDIPSIVENFAWSVPVVTVGQDVKVILNNQKYIKVEAKTPRIDYIGRPIVVDGFSVKKTDGLKQGFNLDFDNLYNTFDIPTFVPRSEILLRIERGQFDYGRISEKYPETLNANESINFRWRVMKDGNMHLPVDQFPQWLGVNRLRLDQVVNEKGEILDGVEIDLVGWTHVQYLTGTPLYAVKTLNEQRMSIEKPNVEYTNAVNKAWFMRIKEGKFTKKIQLPYYEKAEGTIETNNKPAIYMRYPMLDGLVEREGQIVEIEAEYAIPEFGRQEFFEDKKIFIPSEQPLIINDYSVKVCNENIVLRNNHEQESNRVWVVRNNQHIELGIKDIDKSKGVFYLIDRIQDGDQVYVQYMYEEDAYTYKGFLRENMKYETVEKVLDMEISFSADLKIDVDYIPLDLSITEDVIPESWCIDGSTTAANSNGGKVFLFLDNGETKESVRSYRYRNLNLLTEILVKMGKTLVSVYPSTINTIQFDYEKDLLFVQAVYAENPTVTNSARLSIEKLIKQGASGILSGEHGGLVKWQEFINLSLKNYGITVAGSSGDKNANFFEKTADFPGLENYAVAQSASGTITISENSSFKPLLYSQVDQKALIAYSKKVVNNREQMLIVTGDSNMWEDKYAIADSMNKFIEIVFRRMTKIPPDPITIKTISNQAIQKVRVFMNETYNVLGTNSFEKTFSTPIAIGEHIIDVSGLITEADQSNETGKFDRNANAQNVITIEYITEYGSEKITLLIKACEPPVEIKDDIIIQKMNIPNTWFINGSTSEASKLNGVAYICFTGAFLADEESGLNYIAKELTQTISNIKKYIPNVRILAEDTIDSINFNKENDLLYIQRLDGVYPKIMEKLQQIISSGANVIISGEFGDIKNWQASYNKLMNPYGLKISGTSLDRTPNNFEITEEFKGLEQYKAGIAASGYLTIDATSNFKPLLKEASTGGVLMAYLKDIVNDRMIIATGDSNMWEDSFLIDEGLAEVTRRIFRKMVKIEPVNLILRIMNDQEVNNIKLFINKPYLSTGEGSYEKTVNYAAGENQIILNELISEALASGKTGPYEMGATNSFTIEFTSALGTKRKISFDMKEGE